MKSTIGIVVATALWLVSTASAADVKLESDTDKEIYALGLSVARSLSVFNLSEAEMQVLEEGLADGVLGKTPKVDLAAYGPKLQELAKARAAQVAEVEKKASEEFLKKAAAEKGATKSESGLIFSDVAPGKGASPTPDSSVKVNYKGTLRDGTVFDSSYERKSPVTFGLKQVIPCWTEGLQKMKVGGKAKLVCPAEIAYGDRGAPPLIKPGAPLTFEIELLEIVEPTAGKK
jgi:FKBP-type peptidyl-prolyl cis-trans isomerase FkpA/FKBP-type peptidyl-prolyl cis-trans isomerase FklB